jgi:ABC-type uncharacterized transport system substrate-binding protein
MISPITRRQYIKFLCCLFSITLMLPLTYVQAHPHSWIDLKTEIVGNETQILGFNMSWTFDAMTSAYMLDGEDLSANNKSKTLAKIASSLMENINVEHYFTHFYDGETPIKHGFSEQGLLTHNKTKLTLDFYLPLSKPKEINNRSMTLFVFEAGYYVDMSWVSENDIQFSSELNKHCSLELILPNPTAEQFTYAMSLPVDADPSYELGQVFSQTVNIICNK